MIKRVLTSLIALNIFFGVLHPVLADDTPTTTSAQQLEALQAQRQQAIEQRNTDQAKREAAQKELSSLRQQRADASDAQKAGFDERIKNQEEAIKSIDKDLQNRNERITDLDKQVENNTSYKISQINKKYEDLLSGTDTSMDEIVRKQAECSVQAGSNTGTQEFCKKYYELQIAANEEYQVFLEARKQVELAQADPEKKDEVSALQGIADDAGSEVAKIISEITKMETQKNQNATFNVSNIFTLNQPSEDGSNRRTIRGVVNTIADWLITLVSSLAVTALIIGGFMMIISGGDENRLEMGKTIFIYSLIGLTVTLISYGLITFIQSLFYPG